MASIAASNSLPATGDGELSLLRLYVMRAIYLLIGLGEGSQIAPALFSHEPMARGVIPALLSAMCLLMLVGLRYPRQMLPLLLFEMAWKSIWFFAFAFRSTCPARSRRPSRRISRRSPPVWSSCRS
jgi:hypothetical protein